MSAEAELVKLEAKVLATSGIAGWLKSVDTLRVLLARESPQIKAIVLAMVAPRVEAQALAAVLDAFGLGANDALAIVSASTDLADLPRVGKPSKAATSLVAGLDKAGRQALAAAQKLARAGAPAESILAPLFGHANKTRMAVSDGVNLSGNEGATAVADAAELPTVWVAEVNACVECLKYSGLVAKPGEKFPGGLTFGRKSYNPKAIKSPPRHPRCRCTVEPLNSQEYADALRREAERSVLRGFSLESESMSTRLDAADRLVKSGVDAPKSVIKYAEKSVKDGEFPTRGRPKG